MPYFEWIGKKMKKPKAIIFDWDDTLVDTWRVILKALNTTFAALGAPEWSEAEAKQRIGPPARKLFTDIFGEARWQEADAIYIDSYLKNIEGHIRVHDHVPGILQMLADSGIYLAVVSTKRGPILRQEAETLGFDAYFKSLVGAGDAAKDKPDAATVLLALKDSGIEPGPEVWFIGDGNTDMICARNAGCTPLLIETKLPSEESLAQNPPAFRFKNHRELLDFLARELKAEPHPKAAKPADFTPCE
jgi:phosphoglycolate phosphatase